MINFHSTCFLSSSLVPTTPLFLSLSLPPFSHVRRGPVVRIVRSPDGRPGEPLGTLSVYLFHLDGFFCIYLFTSFHLLISFCNSVITVLCQPVINGPTEPITNMARLRVSKKRRIHCHSVPIIVNSYYR